MTNKARFISIVSKEKTDTIKINSERIRNRAMLKESQDIALKVLLKLDKLKWSQKDLASAMGVSPQQVNKIVSGKENLTLETQLKLQTILDIPILASYYDKHVKKIEEDVITYLHREKYSFVPSIQNNKAYDQGKIIKMNFNTEDKTSNYQIAR
jgi:transcriptional regulator with XRE-family HTH domain